MATVVAVLVTLISLAHLGDFLLGDKGQRTLKNRLVDLYIAVSDGDWSVIVRAPALFFRRYLKQAFYVHHKHLIFAFRTLAYSVAITAFVYILTLSFNLPIHPSPIVFPFDTRGIS